MSTLFAVTSNSRPSGLNIKLGDTFFEKDTGKIIIFNGAGWIEYSPAGSGESVDDSGQINIIYGTFDEILAVPDKKPGDLFFKKNEPFVQTITFTHVPGTSNPPGVPGNNAYIYIRKMDDQDVITTASSRFRLTVNAAGAGDYIDMDQANWGTSDWQGSQNLIANWVSRGLMPSGATSIITGDYKEVITFTSPTWFHVFAGHFYLHYGAQPDFYNVEDALLIYTGLDSRNNELYSMITNY